MMQDVSTKGILYWAELPTVGSNVVAPDRGCIWNEKSDPIQMLRSWFQWNSSCDAVNAIANDANAVTAAATWEHYRWSIDGQACHTRNIGMCCSKAKRENRGEWEIKQEAERHWEKERHTLFQAKRMAGEKETTREGTKISMPWCLPLLY